MSSYTPSTIALRNLEFIQRYLKSIRVLSCEILQESKDVNEELDRITNNTQEIIDNTEELSENTETLIENSETIITNTATTNTNLETVISRLETINETLEGGGTPADPCPSCIVDRLTNIEAYLLNTTIVNLLDTNENGLVKIITTINNSTGIVTTMITDMEGTVITTPITPYRAPV